MVLLQRIIFAVSASILYANCGHVVDTKLPSSVSNDRLMRRGDLEPDLQQDDSHQNQNSIVTLTAGGGHETVGDKQKWEQPVEMDLETDIMDIIRSKIHYARDDTEEVRQYVKGTTPSTNIELGTPKKKVFVILDTGSDKLVAKTWSSIQRLLKTVDGGLDDAVLPSSNVYNRLNSSTYVQVDATDSEEGHHNKDADNEHSLRKGPAQKRGFIAYGSGVAITEEGLDTVRIAGKTLENFPLSEIAADSLSMLHTKQGIAGILGLQHMKNKSMGESVFTRARAKGKMYSFGYCRGDNNDGTFIWGDQSTEGHKLDVIGQIHWAVELKNVKMSNTSKHMTVTEPEKTRIDEDNEPPMDSGDFVAAKTQRRHAIFGGPNGGSSHEVGNFDDWMGRGGELPGFPPSSGHVEPLGHAQGSFGLISRSSMLEESTSIAELKEASPHDKQRQPTDTEIEKPEGSKLSDDPVFKKEIGKMVGDIIDKIVQRVEHGKVGTVTEAVGTSSKASCTDTQRCTAILDTGSNIIAGPSAAIREMVKFANVKYDCSNFNQLPNMHLDLGDFQVELPSKAYVMQVKLPKWASRPEGAEQGGGMGGMGGDDMDPGSDSGHDDFGGAGASANGGFGFVKKIRAKAWRSAFLKLGKQFGLDLSSVLKGVDFRGLAHTDKLCMPALVPLDKETKVGKLWVVGTPLFEQYYTRWTWAKEDESPKVYLEDKYKAKTCQGTPAHNDDARGASQMLVQTSGASPSPLLRRERKLESEAMQSSGMHNKEPSNVVDIFDIRYPHWAKTLNDI